MKPRIRISGVFRTKQGALRLRRAAQRPVDRAEAGPELHEILPGGPVALLANVESKPLH